jgi:TonB family protein
MIEIRELEVEIQLSPEQDPNQYRQQPRRALAGVSKGVWLALGTAVFLTLSRNPQSVLERTRVAARFAASGNNDSGAAIETLLARTANPPANVPANVPGNVPAAPAVAPANQPPNPAANQARSQPVIPPMIPPAVQPVGQPASPAQPAGSGANPATPARPAVNTPPATNPVTPPARIAVTSEFLRGRLIQPAILPTYPLLARQMRIEDTVRLQILIGTDGSLMGDPTVLSGNPLLRESALAAVRRWKYTPSFLDGKAIEMVGLIEVHFRLRDAQ